MASAAVRRWNPKVFAAIRSPLSTAAAVAAPPSDPAPSPPPPPASSAPSCAPNTVAAFKSAIWSESNPVRIADLFRSAADGFPRFHSHRPIFDLVVRKLARARRPDLVDDLLSPLVSDPLAPRSEGFMVRLISLYSTARMPDHAAAVFDRIPGVLGRSRSDKSLSALLSAYFHNRRYDSVVETFNRAPKEYGIAPSLISHNILLQSLCAKGDIDSARAMLDEMASKGMNPNIISYNTLLNAYLKKGDDARFEEILKEIFNTSLEPNVGTHNCRILNHCQKKETFKAEELLDVMVSKGIQPNLTTFIAIIDGFSKEGDASSAVRVFKRMRVMKRMNGKEGVSPKADIYVSLIRVLVENGEFDEGLKICKKCLVKKYVPPFDVVKGLIDGLMKNSKFDEAKDVVAKMSLTTRGEAADAWKKLESTISL